MISVPAVSSKLVLPGFRNNYIGIIDILHLAFDNGKLSGETRIGLICPEPSSKRYIPLQVFWILG